MKERNLNFDVMRLLGLVAIMVAHSSPPGWLFQLRNFGTPLLIMGSGLTYALIYSSKEMDVGKFLLKRISRLILPAWIFLSFFFLAFYFAAGLAEKEYPFSLYRIVSSYLFMEGIGFVWVFKIYLILALLTPLALYINKNINSDYKYYVALIASYAFYELAISVVMPYLKLKEVFGSIVSILVPYSLLYLYAFRLAKLKNYTIAIIAALSFIIFFVIAIIKYQEAGSFVPTQKYKYPPTIYYLSYAFFAINSIFLVIKGFNFKRYAIRKILTWLSSNSLWIYLWHIFAFYIWVYLVPDPKGDVILFLVKVVFLFAFGIVVTIFQNKLVSIISTKSPTFKNKISPLLSSGS